MSGNRRQPERPSSALLPSPRGAGRREGGGGFIAARVRPLPPATGVRRRRIHPVGSETMDTEKRNTPRHKVSSAVMITPNGHGHEAQVFDISAGGARVGLSDDWTPADGASLRVFFLFDTDYPIMLQGHVTRVAVDHLGLKFEPAQDERIFDSFRRFCADGSGRVRRAFYAACFAMRKGGRR